MGFWIWVLGKVFYMGVLVRFLIWVFRYVILMRFSDMGF